MGKVPLSSQLGTHKPVKARFLLFFYRQVCKNIQGVFASLDTRAVHRWVDVSSEPMPALLGVCPKPSPVENLALDRARIWP